jgi:O-antigen/teichoic acid export membrane protein
MSGKKDSYWLVSLLSTFLQRFSRPAFGVLNFMMLTRMLSRYEFGVWSIFLVISTTFEMTKSALLKTAHIKFAAASSDKAEHIAISWSSLTLNFLLTITYWTGLYIFANPIGVWLKSGSDFAASISWYIPGIIGTAFLSHYDAISRAKLNFKNGLYSNLAQYIYFFTVVGIYFIIKTKIELNEVILHYGIGSLAAAGVMFTLNLKSLSFRFGATRLWMGKLISFGKYIWGSNLIGNLSNNFDQMLTARFLSPTTAAHYGIAARIISVVEIPLFAAAEVLFPKMTKAVEEEGTGRAKWYLEKMIASLYIVMTPAVLVMVVFAKWIVLLLAGNAYLDAVPIVQLYIFRILLIILQLQSGQTLISIGKSVLHFKMTAISFVLRVVVLYVCYKQIGLYGAAWGNIVMAVISLFYWYLLMRKEVGMEAGSIFKHLKEQLLLVKRLIGSKIEQITPKAKIKTAE